MIDKQDPIQLSAIVTKISGMITAAVAFFEYKIAAIFGFAVEWLNGSESSPEEVSTVTLTVTEWGVIIGVIFTALSFFTQVLLSYNKNRRLNEQSERERVEHELRVIQLNRQIDKH